MRNMKMPGGKPGNFVFLVMSGFNRCVRSQNAPESKGSLIRSQAAC